MSVKDSFAKQKSAARSYIARKNRSIRSSTHRGATKVTSWYSRSQRAVLYVAGFGFIDSAFWQWNSIAGSAATGVSLLILGTLVGGGDE